MSTETHIRNPLEWGWRQLGRARWAGTAADLTVRGGAAGYDAPPAVRRIAPAAVWDALRRGTDDFMACRSDVIALCLVYPLAGLVLARLAFGYDMVAMLFPLVSGFALIGPVAAVGMYEMSRRRALGQPVAWGDAFCVLASPRFGAILALGLVLLAVFALWMAAASWIYAATLGPESPASVAAFASAVLTTPEGWTMVAVGIGVGFLFAVAVLAISAVSFPMLLDRDVSLSIAVWTSLRVVATNPVTMALWGLVVAVGLFLGALPLLLGLVIVVPVLGHATWHLYRIAVAD